MRVLVFSDLHGDEMLIKKVRALSRDAEIGICCGDITPIHGSSRDVARRIGRMDELLIIPGNFEMPQELEIICQEYGWKSIHGKSVRIGDITIAGCGGAIKGPFNTPYEIEEEDMDKILRSLNNPDILVTHTPPKGATDSIKGMNIGSDAVKRFIIEKNPSLNICGHVHENGGSEATIGNTRVMNVAREVRIIDI